MQHLSRKTYTEGLKKFKAKITTKSYVPTSMLDEGFFMVVPEETREVILYGTDKDDAIKTAEYHYFLTLKSVEIIEEIMADHAEENRSSTDISVQQALAVNDDLRFEHDGHQRASGQYRSEANTTEPESTGAQPDLHSCSVGSPNGEGGESSQGEVADPPPLFYSFDPNEPPEARVCPKCRTKGFHNCAVRD